MGQDKAKKKDEKGVGRGEMRQRKREKLEEGENDTQN